MTAGIPVGPRRARLDDVALEAGVSLGTVSNVLNHPDRVAPATRIRVTAAMEQLGFRANSMASALARGTSRTIGLVVIDIGNSLFVDIARGAQHAARERGYYLQVGIADNDDGLFDTHLEMMSGARVAGILAAPLADQREAVESLRTQGAPVVLLNHDTAEHDGCRVLVDNERAGYIAAHHLIELGRRRLAFVGGRDNLQPVALRRAGVRRAVAEAQGVTLQEIDVTTLEPDSGVLAARRIAELPGDERPDGIVAVTDLLAMAIISEFVARVVRVPRDIAVMGCDHNSAAWGGAVPLTSVSMEGERMGAEGLRLLLDELEQPPGVHTHSTVVLRPRLMAKESTTGRVS